MNYRYNISKKCPSCEASFVTDLFNEQELCNNCKDTAFDMFADDEEDQLEIDMLLHPSGCRTKVYYYD